jgi:hypothetical protein
MITRFNGVILVVSSWLIRTTVTTTISFCNGATISFEDKTVGSQNNKKKKKKNHGGGYIPPGIHGAVPRFPPIDMQKFNNNNHDVGSDVKLIPRKNADNSSTKTDGDVSWDSRTKLRIVGGSFADVSKT